MDSDSVTYTIAKRLIRKNIYGLDNDSREEKFVFDKSGMTLNSQLSPKSLNPTFNLHITECGMIN